MTFVTITVTSQGVHSLSIVLIDVTVPSNTRVLLGAAASDRPSPAIEVTTPTAATLKWSPSRMFPRPANDLPFSSERQGRLRAYHGREEPRAQPRRRGRSVPSRGGCGVRLLQRRVRQGDESLWFTPRTPPPPPRSDSVSHARAALVQSAARRLTVGALGPPQPPTERETSTLADASPVGLHGRRGDDPTSRCPPFDESAF